MQCNLAPTVEEILGSVLMGKLKLLSSSLDHFKSVFDVLGRDSRDCCWSLLSYHRKVRIYTWKQLWTTFFQEAVTRDFCFYYIFNYQPQLVPTPYTKQYWIRFQTRQDERNFRKSFAVKIRLREISNIHECNKFRKRLFWPTVCKSKTSSSHNWK